MRISESHCDLWIECEVYSGSRLQFMGNLSAWCALLIRLGSGI